MSKLIYCIPFVLLLFTGCNSVYERYYPLPGNKWAHGTKLNFEVPVNKNAVYNMYLQVRNSESYAYSNLWLRMKTTPPGGEKISEQYNVNVADNYGRWHGTNIGAYHDHKYLVKENVKFDTSGVFTFSLQHDMRRDTVIGIVDIGVRLVRVD
ncbi:MAG: gliding motility lipoprotein GldH [Bacteroidota bacterium]|nr:gliding motility lipoprotein GldH [Bacteroidota bacterium]